MDSPLRNEGSDGDATQWVAQADAGQTDAVNRLFATLHGQLKRSAIAHMRKESRSHFLAMASIMRRRTLVNHAGAKQAAKRDVPLVLLALTEAQHVAAGDAAHVMRVHDALLAFEQVDARAAQVVELKFFGDLETDETAELLGLPSATVKRDWALARAWLHRELAAR